MRLQTRLGITFLGLLIPALVNAKTFNEAEVYRLEGTIMVQHPGDDKPTALQTGSTVEKGDILNVYDKSWVILKTHKGDRIGLDGGTSVVLDEYYIEGPDRQIRLILQKGNLLLKINGCNSRQSFFEINAGSVVTSIGEVNGILQYDPSKELFTAQYFSGKMSVIDKNNEQKFKEQHMEHHWQNGVMQEEEGVPVDELDVINFRKFFDIEPRLEPADNNMLLDDTESVPLRKR